MRIWMLVPLVVLTGCSALGVTQETKAKTDRTKLGFFREEQRVDRQTALSAEGKPLEAMREFPWALLFGGGGVGAGLLALRSLGRVKKAGKVMTRVIQGQLDNKKLDGDTIKSEVAASTLGGAAYSKIVRGLKT